MCVGGETHWEEDSVVLQREHCVCGRRDSLGERQCSVTERTLCVWDETHWEKDSVVLQREHCVCGRRDSLGERQYSVTERALCVWEERLTGRKTV